MRIRRLGDTIFPGTLPFPRGGLASYAQIGRPPAGERDFSRQMAIPPRGDGIFRVRAFLPRGAKGSAGWVEVAAPAEPAQNASSFSPGEMGVPVALAGGDLQHATTA
jgi:hypothetical protein